MSVTYLFLKKLHNPRFQHSPLPADLYGWEFFVYDHLAHLLARGFEQGGGFFNRQNFVISHAQGPFLCVCGAEENSLFFCSL